MFVGWPGLESPLKPGSVALVHLAAGLGEGFAGNPDPLSGGLRPASPRLAGVP